MGTARVYVEVPESVDAHHLAEQLTQALTYSHITFDCPIQIIRGLPRAHAPAGERVIDEMACSWQNIMKAAR